MLEWLTDNVAFFKIHHNAHREFGMSVKEHLAYRKRIGDTPELTGEDALGDELWEVLVTLPDETQLDVAGPDLAQCVRSLRQRIMATRRCPDSLAA